MANPKNKRNENKLGAYLQQSILERRISLKLLAEGAGLSPSYVSEIINGKNTPEAGVCNSLADYLGVPRIMIYELAGWVNTKSGYMEEFIEASRENKAIEQLIDAIMALKEPERSEKIKMILAGWGR